MYEIPMMESNYGPGFIFYSKDVVAMRFNNSPLYFLHIPSGLITKNNPTNSGGRFYLNPDFDYTSLLTPMNPPEIIVDGKTVAYTGQGAFYTQHETWYVPIRDFAAAVEANLQYNELEHRLSIKTKSHTATLDLNDPSYIVADGRSYAPIESLATALGYFAVIDDEKYMTGYKAGSLLLFSKNFDEATFMKRYPDSGKVMHQATYYQVMWDRLEVLAGELKVYDYNGSPKYRFVFQQGKLKSIVLFRYPARTTKGLRNMESKKEDVLALYGPMEAVQDGNEETFTYRYDINDIVFKIIGGRVEEVHYYPK
jgi:hypothetical protein